MTSMCALGSSIAPNLLTPNAADARLSQANDDGAIREDADQDGAHFLILPIAPHADVNGTHFVGRYVREKRPLPIVGEAQVLFATGYLEKRERRIAIRLAVVDDRLLKEVVALVGRNDGNAIAESKGQSR